MNTRTTCERDATSDTIDLERIEATVAPAPSEVGLCVADAHPVLAGRVLVRFERGRGPVDHWLPCLMTVCPREGDRLLVLRAAGAAEGIVVGIVDGFRRRAEPEPRIANTRALKQDESVRIQAADGRGLVEVRASEAGCVVTLLSSDATLAADGALTIEAETLALRARQGAVSVTASEDVEIQGEHVRLN